MGRNPLLINHENMGKFKEGEFVLFRGDEVYYIDDKTIQWKETGKGWIGKGAGLPSYGKGGYRNVKMEDIEPLLFKVGDRVKQVGSGRGSGPEYNGHFFIIEKMDTQCYNVRHEETGKTLKNINYKAFELAPKKKFNVGDEVRVIKAGSGAAGCNGIKGTIINKPSGDINGRSEAPYIRITEDKPGSSYTKAGKVWGVGREAVLEAVETKPTLKLNKNIKNMEIYKTTEGEFIIKNKEGEIVGYNAEGERLVNIEGEVTDKLRSNSKIHKEITAKLKAEQKVKESRTLIDKIKGYDIFLDRKDFSLNIDIDGEVLPLTKEAIDKLKTGMKDIEKLKVSVKTKASSCNLGDRVLLFGPTGTGKTYDFLATVEEMIKAGTLDAYDVVTITEGFEDIDFLAHIVPTEKGIRYSEKKIVSLLRDAAGGKKVAILLDELNRGSKSFLNLVLKLLDAVDGDNYVLSNFIKDETIVIPQKNVLFFATMNLGGKYVGTSALDEALLDRFNRVNYKGYNLEVEKEMYKAFGGEAGKAGDIVKYVRDLSSDGEIRAPISTRGVKMWAEAFINSGKTKEDFVATFNSVLLNRLTSVDDFGNPNREEESLILKKFKDLGLIS